MYRHLGTEQLIKCPLATGALPPKNEALVELAKKMGVEALGEIKARPSVRQANSYEVVQGVQFWQAALYAHIMELTVQVERYSDQTAKAMLTAEGIEVKQKLNPITLAQRILAKVKEEQAHGNRAYGQEQAGAEYRLSRTTTSHLVRLLRLPKELQHAVQTGKLPVRIARLLVTLTPERQDAAYQHYLLASSHSKAKHRKSKHLTAAEMERWLSNQEGGVWAEDHARQLKAKFQCEVGILDRAGEGEVTFYYTSNEELGRLYRLWHFQPV